MQHFLTAVAVSRLFHEKFDKPSCAGRIDCTASFSDSRGMSFRVFISSWSRAFTCIVFALALVLSPPSAAHAASGMHDGHQAKSVGVVDAAEAHHTGSDAHHAHEKLKVASDIGMAASDKDGKEQQSQECCNGICISVVFLEDTKVRTEPDGTREYVIPRRQTYSAVTTGFLRPPRFLI